MPFSLDRYFCDLKFCSLRANQLKVCDHHGQQLHAQNTISNKKTQIQTIPGKLTWNLNKGKSSSRVYINSLAPRKRSSSPLDRLLLHIILRCIQSILRSCGKNMSWKTHKFQVIKRRCLSLCMCMHVFVCHTFTICEPKFHDQQGVRLC